MNARGLLLFALLVPSLLLVAGPSAPSRASSAPAARAPVYGPGPTIALQRPDGRAAAQIKESTLDGHLQLLVDAVQRNPSYATAAGAAGLPPELRALVAGKALRLSADGAVQVYVLLAVPSRDVRPQLEALGARIERIDEDAGIAQAQVPVAALEAVAALDGVRGVRLPDYGVSSAGSVTTGGDGVLRADDARAAWDIDGSGVTVGAVSDGLRGMTTAQLTADLPLVDTATCNITGSSPALAGAEGTALLEIVHDLAPGASLMFGHFSTQFGLGTSLDFNAAVSCLAEHADIVLDDIGFFGAGPYDGTSDISQNTAAALNGDGPIKAYFTAVGNAARQHYQGDFVDSGTDLSDGTSTWSAHQFEASPGASGTEHAGLNPDPSPVNRFLLPPGAGATLVLVWDDPWGTSANDYDLFIQSGPQAFFCGFDRQDGAGDNDYPVETCTVSNPTLATLSIDVLFGNYQDLAAPKNLDLFVLCGACLTLVNGNRLDFTTGAGSVPNQADAGGSPVSVISVGAVRYQAPNAAELFSGRGPTNDGRIKPDVMATDGVSVSGAGGFGTPFFGTSAATPHAAAVAALILECRPDATRQELRDYVLETAQDLGVFGPDNTFGWGRANAFAAGTAANCAGATPTPTASPGPPTPTGTQTPSATPTPLCSPGDANRSGVVNAIDSAVVLQYVAGLLDELPCLAGSDVDESGAVDAVDAALILQFVAGLVAQLPV